MSFDIATRTLLEHYTIHPPPSEDMWYGPWNTILTTLFPAGQGYIITPQRRIIEDNETKPYIPDFIIEVLKLSTPPLTFRTVLIVKIKNTEHWPNGIPALERQIHRQTDVAFAGTAFHKVYWIGTIGPHWRYGVREYNGQDPRALIDWHDVTHDNASFYDFQDLAGLVAAL